MYDAANASKLTNTTIGTRTFTLLGIRAIPDARDPGAKFPFTFRALKF